jgi:cell division protein CrgA
VLAAHRRFVQEITLPKSKTRKKSVYTPPPRSSKAKVSPPWLVPLMLGCLLVGLAWIATFYISGQDLPVAALHQWNLVVGFALIVAGVMLATKWQ